MVFVTSLRLLLSPMAICDDACETECSQSGAASEAGANDGEGVGVVAEIATTDRSAPQPPGQCPPDRQCLCTHHRSSMLRQADVDSASTWAGRCR